MRGRRSRWPLAWLAGGTLAVVVLGCFAVLVGRFASATVGGPSLQSMAGPPPAKTFRIDYGTGWFVDGSGDLLTAGHAAAGCRRITVYAPSFPTRVATVTAVDARHDLALLHVPVASADWLDLAPPGPPKGDGRADVSGQSRSAPFVLPRPRAPSAGRAWSLGFPLLPSVAAVGEAYVPLDPYARPGLDPRLHLGGVTAPGQSGSPVLDEHARVVGVLVQGMLAAGHQPVPMGPAGTGYESALAVPAVDVSAFLDRQGVAPGARPALAPRGIVPSGRTFVPSPRVVAAVVKVFCFSHYQN